MSGTWPEGYGYLPLGEVTSTLDEGRARLGDLSGPTWITASRQTAARGRRGRAWANPEGNFAATLVLPSLPDPERAALRSFVAALALDEAATALTGRGSAFALKWPNDVLLNGGKVAGILLESLAGEGRIHGVMIGIGVNLVAAPPREQLETGAVAPVSLMGEIGLAVTPETFLEALAPAYARWEAQLRQFGFGPVRTAWCARAARMGEEITARLPRETITGIFTDVDEDGQLVLSTPKGAARIAAGEVFF